MRKLLRKGLASLILFGATWTFCQLSLSAFSSATHEYATKKGIAICTSVFKEASELYDERSVVQLLVFCTKPDEDEIEGAFKVHFYNPATEKNFNGEDDSALSRYKVHYNSAVDFFKKGEKDKAISELGRAIHFMEDMNTPVHTNNQSFIDSTIDVFLHTSFEKRCEEIQSTVDASMQRREFDYYKNNTLEQIGKASAMLANDNFYALYKKTLERDIVAKNSVENAQKAVAGLLYRFFLEMRKYI